MKKEIEEITEDVVVGFKYIGIAIASISFLAAIIFGILSIFWVIDGTIKFGWWQIPLWLLLLVVIAGAIGAAIRAGTEDRD